MKKTFFIPFVLLLFFVVTTQAQKFKTNTGRAKLSASNYKAIQAENNDVKVALDLSNGKLVASMNIQGFNFKQGLMRTHFNKDMNSAEYPTAKFVGTVSGYSKLKKSGKYTLNASGKLTIRGVSKTKTLKLSLTVTNGTISGVTTFPINPAEFEYGAKEGGKAYDTRKSFKSKKPNASVRMEVNLKKE